MQKFVRIRTRNYTAKPLRRAILTDHWALYRLGSLTSTEDVGIGRHPIEINTVNAIQNSRSKLRMKSCFNKLKVPQAEWWTPDYDGDHDLYHLFKRNILSRNNDDAIDELSYPLVVKRVFGFQGRGMSLINSEKELRTWFHNHSNLNGWYLEQYYNYAREYRLHVATDRGVFLSWRKLRRRDATERWFFNSDNCEWYGEQHAMFDQPKCWKAMCKAALNALKSTGLDIGAVDIRVQSNTQDDPKFIVCEINSAPALGEVGVVMYKEVIRDLINNKANGKSANDL